ncbi:hypothetical protein HY990_06130 [Candidatus Micrarchaeota archaeon]|nr:hypothetical protein [Candidatus Micrarchaeota archaeon]
MELENVGIVLNNLILLGTFIYAYFDKKEWARWLVVSGSSYFMIYFMSVVLYVILFLLIVVIGPPSSALSVGIAILAAAYLLGILAFIKNIFEKTGPRAIIMFVLYLISIGYQFYLASKASDFESYFIALVILNILGIFVIGIMAAIIAILIRKIFPSENLFLTELLETEGSIIFTSKSNRTKNFDAAIITAAGIAYCIWTSILPGLVLSMALGMSDAVY